MTSRRLIPAALLAGVLLLAVQAHAGSNDHFSPTQGVLRGQQIEEGLNRAYEEGLSSSSQTSEEQTQRMLREELRQRQLERLGFYDRPQAQLPHRAPVQCYSTRSGQYVYTSCY